MIDTHCHLTDPRLGGDIAGVLARAREAGVTDIVTIGTTPPDWAAARALADAHDGVWFAAGVHPNHSHEFEVDVVGGLREFARHPKCVAIGEMGLDNFHKFAPIARQRAAFAAQLELAAELGMPVVLHCREAIGEALAMVAGYPGVRGVFHCFTGTGAEAAAIAAAGWMLGWTGAVTFKRNDVLRQAVADAPAGQIVIETDGPYLAPEPHRARRDNEPALVRHVLQTLATARGIGVAEADVLTTANARRLYPRLL